MIVGGKKNPSSFWQLSMNRAWKMTSKTTVWSSWSFACEVLFPPKLSCEFFSPKLCSCQEQAGIRQMVSVCWLIQSLARVWPEVNDHVFTCHPAVKAGDGASSTAGMINHHLHPFISKLLMFSAYLELDRTSSEGIEKRASSPDPNLQSEGITHRIYSVVCQKPGRAPAKQEHPATLDQEVMLNCMFQNHYELNSTPKEKIHRSPKSWPYRSVWNCFFFFFLLR